MPSDQHTPNRDARTYRTYRSRRRLVRRPDREETPRREPEGWVPAGDRRPQGAPAGERPPARSRRRRPRWRLALAALTALILIALIAVGAWALFGWRTVDAAVDKANARLDSAATDELTPDAGSIFSTPTTILILGVDTRTQDPGRSDSIMLLRSNPDTHTFSQLSIARDMRVQIAGHGMGKINTAYFWGGPALAISTVEGFTGVPINHVVLVNFNGFQQVIDAVGGVDVRVPKTIVSWYSGDTTVTFKKGLNHLDGKRAMIYARIRKVDDDFHRQARQQQVMQALQKKLTSWRLAPRLPSIAAQMMKGVSTDLTTWELSQLVWRKWRADTTHRYILTGTPAMIDGQSYVVSDREANLRMIERFQAR